MIFLYEPILGVKDLISLYKIWSRAVLEKYFLLIFVSLEVFERQFWAKTNIRSEFQRFSMIPNVKGDCSDADRYILSSVAHV